MSEKEKPLPKPPATPFGQKKRFEEGEKNPFLLADRMAMAMAEGRLEEFLENELPDNEKARKLAKLMMGMTGMIPSEDSQAGQEKKDENPSEPSEEEGASLETPPQAQPSEDVLKAVEGGNVQELIALLQREHEKRMPGSEKDPVEKREGTPDSANQGVIEKDLIDRLIRISSENNMSIDWLVFRALKVYVQEYEKTGRL